jgi:DUF4097 and DUF4098 domain-containing protein YvlB
MGGNITLTVPGDLSMAIDLEIVYTETGHSSYNISSDFELKIEKTGDHDGMKENQKKIYAKAQIAGGKHKIKIKTINGNIYLKKTK